jgi:hypothetical protein
MNDISYSHLLRLTDNVGIFEHAKFDEPRREHGYCVDDVARALIVVTRAVDPPEQVRGLTDRYLHFLAEAQASSGRVHNRRSVAGRWDSDPTLDDHWGRLLWGLGTAAARAPDESERAFARHRFAISASARSRHRRSLAFAALGAAEIMRVDPDDRRARELLQDVADVIGGPTGSAQWMWPETSLSYANAALPEALIASGDLLGDNRTLDDGLDLLAWLVDVETHDGHFSVTPTGGRRRGSLAPGFDQQPIELAALADACDRAYRVTGDAAWRVAVERAYAWFVGDNDSRVAMADFTTGAGFDGLELGGRNENCGAESTTAMLMTSQLTRIDIVV